MKHFFIIAMWFVLVRSSQGEQPDARAIKGVKTSVAAFVDFFPEGPVNSPALIKSVNELEQQFGKLKAKNEAGYNVRQFFLNGGSEAWVVRVAGRKQASTIVGDSSAGTGLYALDGVDIINLLCLPRASNRSEALKLLKAGGAYAGKRRAILIMDVPKNVTSIQQITKWVSSLPAFQNVAMYYPGIKTAEQPAGMSITGTLSGIIARIDTQYGIWKAPAGPDAWFANVSGFEHEVSGEDGLALTAVGVNPLRTVRGGTRLVWGTRIRTNDPDWKYLPVRRLALYIEESVGRGTRWAATQLNNDSLRAQVRLYTNNFMQNLFLKKALLGSKPSEAYFVRCDKQTTTPEDLNKGMFTIQIGFAAVKTAEFQIVRIHQHARPAR